MPESLFSPDTLAGLDAAERAPAGPDPSERAARAVSRRAVEACDAGRTDEARALLADAVRQTRDLRLLYLAYQFHFRTGDLDEAERLIRRRLELAAPDSADAARAWNNHGLLKFFRHDHASAESMLRRALEIDTRAGCEEGMARDLGNLSLIPEARGDLDEAERLNRESLAIAERIGYEPVIATRLHNLGEIALARGRHAQARSLLEAAQARFQALGQEKHRRHCAELLAGLPPMA